MYMYIYCTVISINQDVTAWRGEVSISKFTVNAMNSICKPSSLSVLSRIIFFRGEVDFAPRACNLVIFVSLFVNICLG